VADQISWIPGVVRRLRAISKRHGLPIVIFGHAGDGNPHPNILFDRRQPEQTATAERIIGEIFAAPLEPEGTLSGEHGVGLLKRPCLEQARFDGHAATHQAIPEYGQRAQSGRVVGLGSFLARVTR